MINSWGMKTSFFSDAFERITSWENLLEAWRRAALGKRRQESVARFEHQVAHRLLKARKAHHFSRRLQGRWRACCNGQITFAEFDATVRGWINHVRFGDTWGLRRHLLWKPLRRA